VSNALAAAAVAHVCQGSITQIAAALSDAVATSRWRMETTVRGDGVLVINDAYNANPESMRAALNVLAVVASARRAAGGRSFAVLGPMAELGETAADEHDALGRHAMRLDISDVIAVGDAAKPIERGAPRPVGPAGYPMSTQRSRFFGRSLRQGMSCWSKLPVRRAWSALLSPSPKIPLPPTPRWGPSREGTRAREDDPDLGRHLAALLDPLHTSCNRLLPSARVRSGDP
jgi:hypothetical protein